MEETKSFNEIREDLYHIGTAKFYHQAVRQFIIRMFEKQEFGKFEPLLEKTKKMSEYSDAKQRKFWDWHFYKQMLTDSRLIDAYLLGERIVPIYTTKELNNKQYFDVKFYPKSAIYNFTIPIYLEDKLEEKND